MGGRPLICFVHIERAGGTTLHYIFRNNYLSFATLTPVKWTNDDEQAFRADDLARLLKWLPFTKGIGGHGTRSYFDYESVAGRPVSYVTFLRDPVKRYISHFNYQVYELGIDWTIESFLAEPRFDDFMTKRIAGTLDVAEAQRRLAADFAFVGLAERFDESLVLMKRALGADRFDARYELRNSSRDPRYDDARRKLSQPSVLDAIRAHNRRDLELYRFARDELFPKFVDDFPGDLAEEARRLAQSNEEFRFSTVRRATWSAYRRLVYRNLESAARQGASSA